MFLCLAGSRGLMTVITRARENPAENFRELCLGLSERWKLHLPIVLGEVFTTGFPRSAIVPKGNGREREQRVRAVSCTEGLIHALPATLIMEPIVGIGKHRPICGHFRAQQKAEEHHQ